MKTATPRLTRALVPLIVITAALSSCVNRTAYVPGAVKSAALSAIVPPPTMTFETKGTSAARHIGETMMRADRGLAATFEHQALAQHGFDASQQTDEAMRQFYAQEVRRILAEELNARGQFKVLGSDGADATIQVRCGEWGLRYIDGGVYTGNMAAIAVLDCVMTDRAGKVVWDDNQFYLNGGKAVAYQSAEQSVRNTWFGYTRSPHKRADFEASPDLVRKELSAAIRHRARQIAMSLPRGGG